MSENVRELTPKQHQAFDLLMADASLSDIAEELDIDLRTLYCWRHLPAFVALEEELRRQRYTEIRESFTEVMRLSFISFERELKKAENPEKYNPIETAIQVMRLMRALPMPTAPAPDPLTVSPNSANS